MNKIFVLGSINTDYVINTDKMPLVGESHNGHSFMSNQGGKGANQAIACKKLGTKDVYLISSVGNDEQGKSLKKEISTYEINIDGFQESKLHTGACIIIYDESKKDNMLVVDKSANDDIDKKIVEEFLRNNASKDDILITQLEVNLDAVINSLKVAKEIGMYTILNPAPVCNLDKDIYKFVDLLVPNETETLLLSNIDVSNSIDAINAYKYFNNLGINELVITCGGNGSYYLSNDICEHFDCDKVEVVDTTSAGDTYIGALAYRKANGFSIFDSMSFAAHCSAITVSRRGAGKTIPTYEEIKKWL